MQKTTAGEGRKTRTVKLDGELYQVRLVTCGKDGCKTCASQGDHVAVYHDTGAKDGARWRYVGSHLPEADPEYRVPVCECEGCSNEVKRRGQRFCSAKCRVKWHRTQR